MSFQSLSIASQLVAVLYQE